MKKLLLTVLTTVFCLSAVTGYAQARKETTLEKMLRLEFENAQLKQQNAQLKQQNAQLKNQAENSVSLKPYYKTEELQNLCEKYPAAKRQIEKTYNKYEGKFQLVKAWTTQEKPINIPFLKHDYKTVTVFHGRGSSKNGTVYIRFPVAQDGKLLP